MKIIKLMALSFAFFLTLVGCEQETIVPTSENEPEILALLLKCPELKSVQCVIPCQIGCSILNNLFGASPGLSGALDKAINCPSHSIPICEYPCEIFTKTSGEELPWVIEWPCESPFNGAAFPLCDDNTDNDPNDYDEISVVEQQQIIDLAKAIAQSNMPTACNSHYNAVYDFFYIREGTSAPGCQSFSIDWRIGVKITYLPTACSGPVE